MCLKSDVLLISACCILYWACLSSRNEGGLPVCLMNHALYVCHSVNARFMMLTEVVEQ